MLSPDGATLAVIDQGLLMLFGVPTEQRLAFASIPIPESINIRQRPSLTSEPIGTFAQGIIVVAGRDVEGQFVYLPNEDG